MSECSFLLSGAVPAGSLFRSLLCSLAELCHSCLYSGDFLTFAGFLTLQRLLSAEEGAGVELPPLLMESLRKQDAWGGGEMLHLELTASGLDT